MSEPLLQVRNNHTLACGDPPVLTTDDPNVYIGYFQNKFGEQWIFIYDRETGEAELCGGDIGWNDRRPVRDGSAESLVLDADERAWLTACWSAASAS